MTAAAFDYHAPATIDEAVTLLGRYGDEARLLAGGQSLVPSLTSRLAQPAHIIDINAIARAERPTFTAGRLRIPPLMRHVDFEEPVEDGPLGHILSALARRLGHWPMRLRGTFCGALAHADPASKWCLAAVALGAEVSLRSAERGTRTLPADRVFETIMTTALADDEMLVEVQIPLLAPFVAWGFDEVVQRKGDFPLASALVLLERDGETVAAPRVALGGLEETPRRLKAVEDLLAGRPARYETFIEAAECAADAIRPATDATADADHASDLARAVVLRALTRAAQSA